jgi:hypothetical protein
MRHFSAPVTGAHAQRDLTQSRPGKKESRKRNGEVLLNTSKIIDVTGRNTVRVSHTHSDIPAGAALVGGFVWGRTVAIILFYVEGASRTHTFARLVVWSCASSHISRFRGIYHHL